MKTRKTFVTMLLLAAVFISSAVEKPKMNVQSINENQVLVTVQNPSATRMEVSILDDNKQIVYYKRSKKAISSFNKIFDVKHLDNGVYAMQVEINGVALSRNLEITSDRIYVSQPKKYTKPHFIQQNNRLIISHLNFENENYRLNIYDGEGLIYKANLVNKSPMHSGFDLSKLKPGNYHIELNSGNKHYAYSFKR